MTICATTKSGSDYIFTQDNQGEFHFMKGIESGKVTFFFKPIEVGETIEFCFIRDGIYGEPESTGIYCRTTQVVKLSISDLIHSSTV